MIKVKPKAGLRIRDPERRDFIEEDGRDVPENHYWMRRLRDGDVVVVSDVKIVTKTKKPSEEASAPDRAGDK